MTKTFKSELALESGSREGPGGSYALLTPRLIVLLRGMPMEIALSRGQVTIIDDEDWEKVKQHKWHANLDRTTGGYYAVATVKKPNGSHSIIQMHRLIKDAPPTLYIDHKDRDTLNNRKTNLRICTHQQNCCNRNGAYKGSSSKFLGIYWNKRDKVWTAYISYHGIRKHLGSFKYETDAAQTRDIAAVEYHGEFAFLNLPKRFEYDR